MERWLMLSNELLLHAACPDKRRRAGGTGLAWLDRVPYVGGLASIYSVSLVAHYSIQTQVIRRKGYNHTDECIASGMYWHG